MADLNAHISVVVHKGEPLDYQMYRHTSIWVRFTDGTPAVVVNIIGSAGFFEFEARDDEDPSQNPAFVKRIDVGYLSAHMTSGDIVDFMENLPIDNQSREFNCQTWVEQSLTALVNRGLLSKGEYDVGLNGMVDAIAEARDDDDI